MYYPAAVSVYIEVVIFNNFAVDALLMLSTAALKRRKCRWWRVLIGAAVGSAVATAYPLMSLGWQIAVRALLAPLLTAIFYGAQGRDKRRKLLDWISALVIFMLLTTMLGGAVYGLSYLTGVDVNAYPVLGLVAAAACMLPIGARIVARKRTKSVKTCVATLNCGGDSVTLEALCDSGNTLVDGVSGLPVVMLSRNAEQRLGKRQPEGMIEVETVGGKSSFVIIDLQSVEVNGVSYRALGALTHRDMAGYDVILQGSMF